MIKKLGKTVLCILLENQVKRLRKRHSFKIVAVGGSVGKTSTKLAIAKVLATRNRVQYQDGNYNDRLTVPLVLFGKVEPGIFNIFAWVKTLLANERIIRNGYPYEIAVLELGTDAPGQMAKFDYLRPELAVITAVAAEHMEFFGSLEKVAQEELAPLKYSRQTLLNSDDISYEFLPDGHPDTYGQGKDATYRLTLASHQSITGQKLAFELRGQKIEAETPLIGRSIAKSLLAAAAAAHIFGWDNEHIVEGIKAVGPVAGRMQVLDGKNGSFILDDTYNASPIAMKAALSTLYDLDVIHRIAILGSMNELGDASQTEHEAIGAFCDPRKLDLVVTVGKESGRYLSPAAEKAGCKVVVCDSPGEAGKHVQSLLKKDTVVLAKGSQNGVFTEEALKPLLNRPADSARLVRQTPYWMGVKRKQFDDI